MQSATIIVPVWNGERTLESCLTSVLKQDLDSPEVIIIDDGSTDQTLEVAKNTVKGKPNVRILSHSKNYGLGKTLNEGIKESNGEFVLIVHSDCEMIESNFLRQAIATLKSHPDVAAITGRREYRVQTLSDKEKLFMVANGHLAEVDHEVADIEDVTFTEHKCDLFRKELVEGVGGFLDARFRRSGEDQVLSSQLRSQGYRLIRLGSISYRLGFGEKESTLRGIFDKLLLYGKTQAGVLLSQRTSSFKGISQSKALSSRAINRIEMILSSLAIVAGVALSLMSPYFISLSISVLAIRLMNYARGLRRLHGRIRLAVVGPILDLAYSFGFAEGVLMSSIGRQL